MKTLNHNDRSGKGLLSEGEVKRVCKAVGLPIHHDLLTALISKFPKTEGMVDHVKFIEDLKSAEKLGRFLKIIIGFSHWYAMAKLQSARSEIEMVTYFFRIS